MKKGFGKGWILIIYSFLAFFFSSGVSSSMNVASVVLSSTKGWSATLLTSMISVGSVANIVAGVVFGRLAVKYSAKKLSIFALVVYIITMLELGAANSLWMFLVCMVLSNGLSNGIGYQLAPVIIAKWFPKRKGIVMGIVTMGIPLCSGFATMLYSFGYEKFGFMGGFLPFTIISVIAGILLVFGISDDPRDRNYNPDNTESAETEEDTVNPVDSIWTTKKLLTTPQVWIHGITLGIQLLFAGGIMVQLYPRLLEIGIAPKMAQLMMLASGLFALPGSYLCGILDSKLGARKAACTSYVFGILAMVLNLTGNIVCVWLSLVCIGMVVGGAANWPASLCIEEFKDSFANGYGIIQPMIQLVGAVGPAFFALIAGATGNYVVSYICAAIMMFVGLVAFKLLTKDGFVAAEEARN